MKMITPMTKTQKIIKITHYQTGELMAQGFEGWNFISFTFSVRY